MKITKERLEKILLEEIANVDEMQGTRTYAYLNSMPAKRDQELDEWLNEALGEGFGFLEKDWAKTAEEDDTAPDIEPVVPGTGGAEVRLADLEKELAAEKEAAKKTPAKTKKGGMLKGAAGLGLRTAGVYQTVQALQALGDLSSDALASIVSKMDPAMVDIIKQISDTAGQIFEDQHALNEWPEYQASSSEEEMIERIDTENVRLSPAECRAKGGEYVFNSSDYRGGRCVGASK